jgi:hypothetical protein
MAARSKGFQHNPQMKVDAGIGHYCRFFYLGYGSQGHDQFIASPRERCDWHLCSELWLGWSHRQNSLKNNNNKILVSKSKLGLKELAETRDGYKISAME